MKLFKLALKIAKTSAKTDIPLKMNRINIAKILCS